MGDYTGLVFRNGSGMGLVMLLQKIGIEISV